MYSSARCCPACPCCLAGNRSELGGFEFEGFPRSRAVPRAPARSLAPFLLRLGGSLWGDDELPDLTDPADELGSGVYLSLGVNPPA